MQTISEKLGEITMTATKREIARSAHQAALAGQTPNEACPYPFGGPRAAYWMRIYRLCRPLATDVATTTKNRA